MRKCAGDLAEIAGCRSKDRAHFRACARARTHAQRPSDLVARLIDTQAEGSGGAACVLSRLLQDDAAEMSVRQASIWRSLTPLKYFIMCILLLLSALLFLRLLVFRLRRLRLRLRHLRRLHLRLLLAALAYTIAY